MNLYVLDCVCFDNIFDEINVNCSIFIVYFINCINLLYYKYKPALAILGHQNFMKKHSISIRAYNRIKSRLKF